MVKGVQFVIHNSGRKTAATTGRWQSSARPDLESRWRA